MPAGLFANMLRGMVCATVVAAPLARTEAQTGDVAAIATLRAQSQHARAIADGKSLWERSDLPDRDRAELAIQLALVHTDTAMAAPPGAANQHWQQALDACQALIDGWPDNPRRPLVEVQRALVTMARGAQARDAGDAAAAMAHLRTAIRELADIGQRVERDLVERRLRARLGEGGDALTIGELESLQLHVTYHLGRAERQAALCHAAGSPDRDDLLLRASQRLTPLAKQSEADALVWNARIELAACHRGLGNSQTAERLVADWLKEQPSPAIAARLNAAVRDQPASPPAALGETPNVAPPAAVEAADAPTNTPGTEPGAAQQSQTAAAERAAGHFAAAARLYRESALAEPAAAEAAPSHRLAILCVADLLREAPPAERTKITDTYRAMLEEHLRVWSAQGTADDVRTWLGRLLVGRRDWPAAVAVLREARPSSDNYRENLALLAAAFEGQLQQSSGNDPQSTARRAELLAAATHLLQPIITGPGNRWPDPWSDVQRSVALALARLHVQFGKPDSPYAVQLLTAALQGAPDLEGGDQAAANWSAETNPLLVAALARGGNIAEAQAIAGRLQSPPPQPVLQALGAIVDGMPRGAPGEPSANPTGQLVLSLVGLVDARHRELDKESIARLNQYRAAALAAIGDRPAAIAQYASAARQSPDDPDVQERYATLLSDSQAPDELRQALATWKTIESRTKPGGERWRRARRARIDLLNRLGDTAQAQKIQRITEAVFPDWDTAPEPH